MAKGPKETKKTVETAATGTEPTTGPRYNLAMDLIIAGFSRYQEGKRFLAAGDKEKSKNSKTKAMKFLLQAMDTQGIAELMYSFNQLNTAAALPEELEEDEGIDPSSFTELDLSDFDDDEDEEIDDDSDEDELDDSDDTSEDDTGDDVSSDLDSDDSDDEDTTTASVNTDDRAKLTLANVLSLNGEPETKRMALELLNPKSAK